jgi:hypothetical protein
VGKNCATCRKQEIFTRQALFNGHWHKEPGMWSPMVRNFAK